jgi:UDP-glucose 4-epimerase
LFHLGATSSLRIRDLAATVASRAQTVLGSDVDVEYPTASVDEEAATFDWRVDRLLSTGWKPTQSLDDEIDATLRLCVEAFVGHA